MKAVCSTTIFLLLAGMLPGTESAGYKDYQRANALFVAQRFAESRAAVEQALQIDPNLVPALTLKAKLAMAGNDFELAGRALEQALRTDPGAQYAQFLYGMQAYLSNDMKSALPRFRKAYELNSTDSRAALYLGLTLESLGQTPEALSLYDAAIRLEQNAGKPQAETFLPQGRLLLLLGRVDEAEHSILKGLKLDRQLRDLHFEYARVLLRKGDAATAVREGESALRLPKGIATDSQIHYLLIRACQQIGDEVGSKEHAATLRAIETSR